MTLTTAGDDARAPLLSRRRKVPPFSQQEDDMILALRAEGASAIRISAFLARETGVDRQPEAVNQRIKALQRGKL